MTTEYDLQRLRNAYEQYGEDDCITECEYCGKITSRMWWEPGPYECRNDGLTLCEDCALLKMQNEREMWYGPWDGEDADT